MAGIINAGSFPKLLRPGLHEVFGMSYEQYADEWTDLFSYNVSHLNYEEETMLTRMGLASVISDGGSIIYDDFKQNYTSRYTHIQVGMGFIVTRIEVDDNLYKSVADFRSEGLAWAMKQTKNYNGANVFNFAFDAAGHPIGDGAALLSATHTTESGNQSNILTVAADLSEASLEELLIQVYDARDNRNTKLMLKEKALVIPSDLQFEATRILKNPQRPGTAERDINAMNIMGKFPGGIIINHFFTDADAWFVTTNCPHGLKYFERRALDFDQDNDFATSNMHFKSTERYSFGVSDWRSLYGSPGA
jgi:hypothetical protein